MAGAASFAYANAPLPPAARTQLVCTERSELPNDSYMLKLQMQVCEPEAPKRPNTEHIAAEARKLHAQAQQLGSTWRPLAPAPAPIMQLQPWQRPPSPQIPPHVHRWTETSHPQTAQVMHPSHQRHYPNVQTRAVSHGWHTHSPSPSPSTHSPSPSSSSRSSSSSPSSTRAPSPAPAPSKPAPPLLLPAPREDCIKRTVPQQVWDPYAPDRSAENAKDVVIHYFPSGVTPLDTARVPFDLRGMPPGTGIPLSVLDAAHIDNTMRYVVDACEPIEIRRQIWERGSCFVASDEMYSYLVLCMKVRIYVASTVPCRGSPRSHAKWPSYPEVSRKRFHWRIAMHDASGPYTRARILSDVSRLVIDFFEACFHAYLSHACLT